MNNLAKMGWSKAMIHQRTLSLVLTLENFLLSGPHILFNDKYQEALSDPNIFFVRNKDYSQNSSDAEGKSEMQNPLNRAHTYYVLRPFIRGILFGLNPLYQISLFVPCTDQKTINLYKEIISKIDIGGQFFQDRVFWNLDSLKRDIMDDKLTCVICEENSPIIRDEWIKNVSIESKPFLVKFDGEVVANNDLFDLVEMRSFLEEMHQRYFSKLIDNKCTHFVNMIRAYISNVNSKKDLDHIRANGFYSVNNGIKNPKHLKRPFSSDRFSLKTEEQKQKNVAKIFKTPKSQTKFWTELDMKSKFEEYENIIVEQLKLHYQISQVDIDPDQFRRSLFRWNVITLRKSEILRSILDDKDGQSTNQKLESLHELYFQKRYQDASPESEIFRSTQSQYSSPDEGSDDNCYILVSDKSERTKHIVTENLENALFTKWYVNQC